MFLDFAVDAESNERCSLVAGFCVAVNGVRVMINRGSPGPVVKRWALQFLLLLLSSSPVTAQTIVFSGVPSNLTVQCLSDEPYALMNEAGVVPYGVPACVVGSVGSTITLQNWGHVPCSSSSGNWGPLNLCGELIGSSVVSEAIVNGVPCQVSVGETVSVSTGFNGVSQGFQERSVVNPIVILPMVDSVPSGNGTVTIRGFIMGQLLPPGSGGGSNWSMPVKILSVAPPTDVTATDYCGVSATVVYAESQSDSATNCNNVITRTWTATDSCGTASATQTIVVADTTPPLIACPANVTVFTDAGLSTTSRVSLGTPAASDNCFGAPTLTNNAPSQFPVGTNAVIWTATDSCGNSASCTQDVIVLDATNFCITSITAQGSDVLLAWIMPQGYTGFVQATSGDITGGYSNTFSDISTAIFVPGNSFLTTNYLDVGDATNFPARYYRVRLVP